jgi:hypothetical protein
MSVINFGEGESCGRNGCAGVIETRPSEGCSCHISPPCSACTEPRNFCPECDWEEGDDPAPEPASPTEQQQSAWAAQRAMWKPRTLADLDGTKIDWIHVPCDSTCSMIKEGVYPDGLQPGELMKAINGTFGGRFAYHHHPENGKPGRFKFIAYTD